jgi:C1A family cysteine protease
LTNQEFSSLYLGAVSTKVSTTTKNSSTITSTSTTTVTPPLVFDLTTSGGVTAIKNQGQCGSCWAFSSTGSLEYLYYKNFTNLVSLSEQQLVDCSTAYGNQGCNGGWMNSAFNYVKVYGIVNETSYPYTAKLGTCNTVNVTKYKVFMNNGFTAITTTNLTCNSLLIANVLNRTISVAVDANNWSNYAKGIFNNCSSNIDHAVLLVGYNTTDSTASYWKVKNSWGTSWGEAGYIRLALGNTCAICNYASFPI